MVITWGKQQLSHNIPDNSCGSFRDWFQKTVMPKCINMQTNHFWDENPDSIVLEGKAAFQPDCGQKQEKPEQSAEKRKTRQDLDHFEKNWEALKQPCHLAQQPPWNVWDVRKGNSKTPVRSPEGRRQTADTAECNGTGGACARCAQDQPLPVGWAARARSSTLERHTSFTCNH